MKKLCFPNCRYLWIKKMLYPRDGVLETSSSCTMTDDPIDLEYNGKGKTLRCKECLREYGESVEPVCKTPTTDEDKNIAVKTLLLNNIMPTPEEWSEAKSLMNTPGAAAFFGCDFCG